MLNISRPDAMKLQKYVGMFGSDFEGERANAAKLATDLLRKNRLTWEDAFKHVFPSTKIWFVDLAELLLEDESWEPAQKFLKEIADGTHKRLSRKQLAWLKKIVDQRRPELVEQYGDKFNQCKCDKCGK